MISEPPINNCLLVDGLHSNRISRLTAKEKQVRSLSCVNLLLLKIKIETRKMDEPKGRRGKSIHTHIPCLIIPGRKNFSNTGLPHRCVPRITFKPKKLIRYSG